MAIFALGITFSGIFFLCFTCAKLDALVKMQKATWKQAVLLQHLQGSDRPLEEESNTNYTRILAQVLSQAVILDQNFSKQVL